MLFFFFFFFQAEDGIRDKLVTGVQTCALPISLMMSGSPLAPVQRQGASSTVTWMCPMRGDTSRAFGPNTGTILRLTARYWMTTRPWTSESASGGSMTILGAGSLASGTTGAGPRMSLAVCAIAVDAHRTAAAPIRPMNACLMTVLLDS